MVRVAWKHISPTLPLSGSLCSWPHQHLGDTDWFAILLRVIFGITVFMRSTSELRLTIACPLHVRISENFACLFGQSLSPFSVWTVMLKTDCAFQNPLEAFSWIHSSSDQRVVVYPSISMNLFLKVVLYVSNWSIIVRPVVPITLYSVLFAFSTFAPSPSHHFGLRSFCWT